MQGDGVMDDPLPDIVRKERLRRDWSVRGASTRGGISNTYWGGFEDYKQPLTPTIVEAVAKAFSWSRSWPAEKAAGDHPSDVDWSALPGVVEAHGQRLQELQDHLEVLVQGLTQRLEDVERQIHSPRRRGTPDP